VAAAPPITVRLLTVIELLPDIVARGRRIRLPVLS
jgi:hypothetical protein